MVDLEARLVDVTRERDYWQNRALTAWAMALQQAIDICAEADKSAHPADLADKLRDLLKRTA